MLGKTSGSVQVQGSLVPGPGYSFKNANFAQVLFGRGNASGLTPPPHPVAPLKANTAIVSPPSFLIRTPTYPKISQ